MGSTSLHWHARRPWRPGTTEPGGCRVHRGPTPGSHALPATPVTQGSDGTRPAQPRRIVAGGRPPAGAGIREYDPYAKLFEERIIFLGS
ncbi:hypothetical protein ACWC5I_39600, partial [Kitasatospora sp. NPDC001574]